MCEVCSEPASLKWLCAREIVIHMDEDEYEQRIEEMVLPMEVKDYLNEIKIGFRE